MNLKEILEASITVGYYLLCNGADIYRVEQSIDYICQAYGLTDIHVFAIPSSIVVTIADGSESLTTSRRITGHRTNLDCVEQLTGLSRYICENTPGYEEIIERMDAIRKRPIWGTPWQYGAHMLAGASFCIFFGGTVPDSLVCALLGAFIMFLTKYMHSLNANGFFINILCSFSAAFIGGKAAPLSKGYLHADSIIIGSIMLLVPGLALANSMRDFISSDTMTGLSRMTEALFVALGVALGVAFAMIFF